MKQRVNPVMVAVAAVAIIVFLVVMYRHFLPPEPRNDTDNPNGMPIYAQKFLQQKKSGNTPSTNTLPGASEQPAAGAGH
jgi:hypothetical protein